jgi:hypothetical protein
MVDEEVRPGLQGVAVDAADIGGLQREDALERDRPDIRFPSARDSASKPRTEASVARVPGLCARAAHLDTARSPPAAATPRCTKPPTAPSSIET